MERFSNIVEDNETTTAIFLSNNVLEANLLRRIILTEIETYCIDIVIFYINTSSRHDEIIALRLGQLVIDHERYTHKENQRIRIDVQGPKEFTTDDIALPFKYKTPIMVLRDNERIACDVIVKKGQAKQHVKWRPVSTVVMQPQDDNFKFTIRTIGMMSGKEILSQAIQKLQTGNFDKKGTTMFSNPEIP